MTSMTGANTITGSAQSDSILGGSGNDRVTIGEGNDTVDGNGGTDTVSFAGRALGVNVTLNSTAAVAFSPVVDSAGTLGTAVGSIVDVENVTGTSQADTIRGDTVNNTIDGGSGNDVIYGYAGADSLVGGGGNDTIYGGLGADTLSGGTGNDVYSYTVGSASAAGTLAVANPTDGAAGTPNVAEVQTLTVGGTWVAGETASFTLNGNTITYVVPAGGTATTAIAAGIQQLVMPSFTSTVATSVVTFTETTPAGVNIAAGTSSVTPAVATGATANAPATWTAPVSPATAATISTTGADVIAWGTGDSLDLTALDGTTAGFVASAVIGTLVSAADAIAAAGTTAGIKFYTGVYSSAGTFTSAASANATDTLVVYDNNDEVASGTNEMIVLTGIVVGSITDTAGVITLTPFGG
jgi:hypothetical protein